MTDSYDSEQRTHIRHSIRTSSLSVLKIGRQEFEVVDYSRNGIRIAGGDQYPIAGWIKGVLCLVGRNPIPIDAIVVRREDGEVGLRLIAPISV